VRVRPIGEPDRGGCAGNFLHCDAVLEIAEPGAAIVLLDGDAEQPELAEPRPQVAREGVGPVDRVGPRSNFGLRERGGRRAYRVGILPQVEVEAFPGVGDHGLPLSSPSANTRLTASGRSSVERWPDSGIVT